MTPTPKNTNLAKELKEMQATLRTHDTRISAVEYWKMMVEAHEQALKTVRQEERAVRQEERQIKGDSLINKELLKALGLALTALVSLAAFIQASR